MEAVFKIRGDEFDEALFKKIKALLRKSDNSSVLIRVTDEQDEYTRTLEKSISELNQPENLLSFTMDSLTTYNTASK
jgi:hypothetical protein